MRNILGSVRTARYEQVLLISSTAVVSSIVLYGLYYYMQAAWQLLALVCSGLLALAGLGLSNLLYHRKLQAPAAYMLLLSLLQFLGAVPLFVNDLALPIVVCAGLIVVLVGADLLPGRWRAWMTSIVGFAVFAWLIDRLAPVPRYAAGALGLSSLYILGVSVTSVASIFWHSKSGPLRALHSIRARVLVTSLLLVVFTGGAISYFSTIVLTHEHQAEALNRLNLVAAHKEGHVEAWVNNIRASIALFVAHATPELAAVLAPQAQQQPAYQAAMQHLKRDVSDRQLPSGIYDVLFVVDAAGNWIIPEGGPRAELPPIMSECIRQLSTTPCLESPRYYDSLGRIAVVATLPVIGQDHRVLGAVVGYAGMEALDEIAEESEGLGSTGVAYLAGSDGTVITKAMRSVMATSAGQKPLSNPGVEAAVSRRTTGSDFYMDEGGVPVVGVYRWIPGLEVALIAEQDQAEALQPSATLFGVHLGIIFILLATAGVTALYLVRSITAPLSRLAATAEQIAAGRLDLTAKAREGDEIGVLARAFNRMTARLHQAREELEVRVQQRTVELDRANSELQAENAVRKQTEQVVQLERNKLKGILDAMDDGVYIVNRQYGIEYSNPALERKYGRPAGRKCHQYLYNLAEPCQWCPNEQVWSGLSVRREATLNDGKTYELFDTRVTNADGTMGKLAIFHDVTARKQAEGALLQRNRDLAVLSRRLVEIQESERQYVARELHDESGQALTSLILRLGMLERDLQRGMPVNGQVGDLKRMVEQVLEDLHALAMDLRPASLDHVGLVAALRQYVERISEHSGLAVDFSSIGLDGDRLPPSIEIALYRIGQEALTNVVRHAHATRADVILERRAEHVKITIEDNGRGFEQATVMETGRLGVLGMRERAEMVGGSLTIDSAPGVGTTLCAEVPYDSTHPHHG